MAKHVWKRSLLAAVCALVMLPCPAAEPVERGGTQSARGDEPIIVVRPSPFGQQRDEFQIGGNKAFMVLPKKHAAEGAMPWIWYAPTFVRENRALPGQSHAWMFEQLLADGFAVGGVDVGESFGNSAGRAVFTEFYRTVTKRYGLLAKVSLLAQSRGGLMLYNWAAEHPDSVACIGGIYPVCDQSSWPGLKRSCQAYGMSEAELRTHLAKHNPIERLAPLAKSQISILHLHGDADTVVPLDRNSAELARRYRALGGAMELLVVPGKGHQVCPEFFHDQRLVDFFLRHGRAIQ